MMSSNSVTSCFPPFYGINPLPLFLEIFIILVYIDEDVHGALCKHAIITLICYQLLASYFCVLNFQDSSTSGYLVLVIILSAVLSGFIISL